MSSKRLLRPVIPANRSEWWRLTAMPDLGELNGPIPRKQNVVDHGFLRTEGGWLLWACIRGCAVSRLIYGWTGESLHAGPWQEDGIKLRADAESGEPAGEGNEQVGAPFFVQRENRTYCFYHGNGIRKLVSEDGGPFERRGLAGMPGGRDIQILEHAGEYFSYATITDKDPDAPEKLTSWVVASRSKDLENWDGNYVVSKGGKPGDGHVDSESPFVVFLDGYFYLFRSSSITFLTYVYRSEDPLDFGIATDAKLIAEFDIKAPELLLVDGQWFISDLYDFQGLHLTKMEWVEE